MPRRLKLLLAEDNPLDAELVLRELARAGFEVDCTRVFTEPEFTKGLEAHPDLVLADFQMPQFTGLRALEIVNERGGEVPFLIVSGAIGEETAVEVMRKGAMDYLLKDRLTRLGSAVTQAIETRRLERERRAALAAVATAEAKYRSLFENSMVGIYQMTDKGVLLIANPALARIVGYERTAELMSSVIVFTDLIGVDPLDRQRFLQTLRTAGEVRRFETELRRPDGSVIWVSASAWRIRDSDGKIRYEGTIEDVTERRQMEEALRANEQRFRTTLERLMEGCQLINRDWRYVYVNEIAARHGRHAASELIGRRMTEVFPGIDQLPMFQTLRACMSDGMPRQIENEFTYPDGTSAVFQLLIQAVPEGLFVLSLDITARKRAEQEIKVQLTELQRWHDLTLGREQRVLALKAEVNELLARAGQPPRYGKGET